MASSMACSKNRHATQCLLRICGARNHRTVRRDVRGWEFVIIRFEERLEGKSLGNLAIASPRRPWATGLRSTLHGAG
jgi:hypothetical protein